MFRFCIENGIVEIGIENHFYEISKCCVHWLYLILYIPNMFSSSKMKELYSVHAIENKTVNTNKIFQSQNDFFFYETKSKRPKWNG